MRLSSRTQIKDFFQYWGKGNTDVVAVTGKYGVIVATVDQLGIQGYLHITKFYSMSEDKYYSKTLTLDANQDLFVPSIDDRIYRMLPPIKETYSIF